MPSPAADADDVTPLPPPVASGAPSVTARVVAFVAVLAAGAAGGFIGYAITDLQCSGDCSTQTGLGGLVGALLGAIGVGVVVQLALQAMSEWKTIKTRNPEAIDRRLPPPATQSRGPRPRVR
jgi:hypothetical protein